METELNISVSSLWDLENWRPLVLCMVGFSWGWELIFPVAYMGEPVFGRCLMSARAVFPVVATLFP